MANLIFRRSLFDTNHQKLFDYLLLPVGTAGPAVRTPSTELKRSGRRGDRTLPIGNLYEVQILLGLGIIRVIRAIRGQKLLNSSGLAASPPQRLQTC